MYVYLESVGSLIDIQNGNIYPCNVDRTPDLNGGGDTWSAHVLLEDEKEDFDNALTDQDIDIIEEINSACRFPASEDN